MGIGLTKIKHVKIPVTDVQRSVAWYQSLLDLELYMEFVEQGVVRGASLLDRDGGYEIACGTGRSALVVPVWPGLTSSRWPRPLELSSSSLPSDAISWGRRTPVSGR
jgi:catechol 2,3-dioxygenase-like lactoylglutathione lyase family enzyme